jgi:phosphatidylglycerophosphatase A
MSSAKVPSPAGKDRLALWLAIWFGCGYFPKAPGTAGTIGALPLYFAVAPFGSWAVLAVAAAVTLIGIWASSRVVAHLGAKDPQIICIDEVAGVLITLAAAPRTVAGIVAGVVLFRVLDVVKPFPARLCERRLTGGAGVVLDDVFAGAWGALVLFGARRLGLL